ncbi:hypothetical protein, partial [Pseudomonas sp. 30_B]|uniref:hypothetical protein n=1 Tax=Pseudomonas sp. 30_B TaxID=2813575 RepID=UPI001A9FA0EF
LEAGFPATRRQAPTRDATRFAKVCGKPMQAAIYAPSTLSSIGLADTATGKHFLLKIRAIIPGNPR